MKVKKDFNALFVANFTLFVSVKNVLTTFYLGFYYLNKLFLSLLFYRFQLIKKN